MGRKSKEKGKRGERELAKRLMDILDIDARRGIQYSGSPDSPDVITSLNGIHWECKRTERLELYPSMEQSAMDSGDDIPVVAHRRNRKDWVFICYLKDLPEVSRLIHEDRCQDQGHQRS